MAPKLTKVRNLGTNTLTLKAQMSSVCATSQLPFNSFPPEGKILNSSSQPPFDIYEMQFVGNIFLALDPKRHRLGPCSIHRDGRPASRLNWPLRVRLRTDLEWISLSLASLFDLVFPWRAADRAILLLHSFLSLLPLTRPRPRTVFQSRYLCWPYLAKWHAVVKVVLLSRGLTWRSQVRANPTPIPTPLIWRYLGAK